MKAFAAIGEAVWWISVVDSTLRQTAAYKSLMDDGPWIKETLSGIRSVRNRIGHEASIVDFVDLDHLMHLSSEKRVLSFWTWKAVSSPKRSGHEADHQAYVSALQGKLVFDTFRTA